MEVSKSLLPEFDEEMATTRKFLELVPDEKLGWKPHEKSMTMGQLAWHLSDMPSWCTYTFKQDTLALSDEDYQKKVEERKDKGAKEILAQFEGDLKEARTRLAAADDTVLAQQWKMTWGGQTVVDMPRRASPSQMGDEPSHSSPCTAGCISAPEWDPDPGRLWTVGG